NSIRSTFRERDSDEALAYSAFFDRWKQDGQRVDLVFNFHNNESNENPHFFVPWFESYGRPASADLAVYNRVRARLERQGLVVAEPPNRWEGTLSRLAGHVAHQFKAAAFLAMVNSRAEEGHLTLEQLKA